MQGNTAMSVSVPVSADSKTLGAIMGTGGELESDGGHDIKEYIVQRNDTLSSIAENYSISLNSILWANEMSSKSTIKPGQKLIIPPVSGVIYHVKDGDTLSEIAETYKGKTSEIIEFNNLSGEVDIYVGDILVVPEGEMPKKTTYYASFPKVPIGSSYFIYPHSAGYISQGLHWYNAIDFAGQCGDPIVAAAGGTVQRVEYGWNGGAGNYVRILHPNGVSTMYGHVQKATVSPGQSVSQGEIIALMGGRPGMAGAGISTGCHVHFDVRGAANPFAR